MWSPLDTSASRSATPPQPAATTQQSGPLPPPQADSSPSTAFPHDLPGTSTSTGAVIFAAASQDVRPQSTSASSEPPPLLKGLLPDEQRLLLKGLPFRLARSGRQLYTDAECERLRGEIAAGQHDGPQQIAQLLTDGVDRTVALTLARELPGRSFAVGAYESSSLDGPRVEGAEVCAFVYQQRSKLTQALHLTAALLLDVLIGPLADRREADLGNGMRLAVELLEVYSRPGNAPLEATFRRMLREQPRTRPEFEAILAGSPMGRPASEDARRSREMCEWMVELTYQTPRLLLHPQLQRPVLNEVLETLGKKRP